MFLIYFSCLRAIRITEFFSSEVLHLRPCHHPLTHVRQAVCIPSTVSWIKGLIQLRNNLPEKWLFGSPVFPYLVHWVIPDTTKVVNAEKGWTSRHSCLWCRERKACWINPQLIYMLYAHLLLIICELCQKCWEILLNIKYSEGLSWNQLALCVVWENWGLIILYLHFAVVLFWS